ncbi:4-(cytidine 5'-diphospho)-2-C-methyl-D-erythritol kinase [Desulfonauticus submarinus]
MDEVLLVSRCKINLFLKIGERLANGYHLLTSLFFPLPYPTDEIKVTLTSEESFFLTSNFKFLEQNNILEKCFWLFKKETGFQGGCKVYLNKRVPIGAGLGGGSANAAVFLNFLNNLLPTPLDKNSLIRIASQLGADVPFFLFNKPSWVEGIGEKIEPVAIDLTGLKGLLICPKIKISTKWAYECWDKIQISKKSFLTLSAWINKKSVSQGRIVLLNDFEKIIFHAYPQMRELKEEIFKLGACGGGLSGSGSAMFFLFRETKKQKQARVVLDKLGLLSYNYSFV